MTEQNELQQRLLLLLLSIDVLHGMTRELNNWQKVRKRLNKDSRNLEKEVQYVEATRAPDPQEEPQPPPRDHKLKSHGFNELFKTRSIYRQRMASGTNCFRPDQSTGSVWLPERIVFDPINLQAAYAGGMDRKVATAGPAKAPHRQRTKEESTRFQKRLLWKEARRLKSSSTGPATKFDKRDVRRLVNLGLGEQQQSSCTFKVSRKQIPKEGTRKYLNWSIRGNRKPSQNGPRRVLLASTKVDVEGDPATKVQSAEGAQKTGQARTWRSATATTLSPEDTSKKTSPGTSSWWDMRIKPSASKFYSRSRRHGGK
ncbi:MAG: hypothetical protein J3Q66DRAFT_439603 [Benniella sp.]|nr:MAG: hypothetical protein J3Q66DRAFT_439603 [Benniella sp.]